MLHGLSAWLASVLGADAGYYASLRAAFASSAQPWCDFWERREAAGSSLNRAFRRAVSAGGGSAGFGSDTDGEGFSPAFWHRGGSGSGGLGLGPGCGSGSGSGSGLGDGGLLRRRRSDPGEPLEGRQDLPPAGEEGAAGYGAGCVALALLALRRLALVGAALLCAPAAFALRLWRLWLLWAKHLVLATVGWLGVPLSARAAGSEVPAGRGGRASAVPLVGQAGGLQGVLEGMDRRGLLEDLQLGTELAVSSVFGTLRAGIWAVLGGPEDAVKGGGRSAPGSPPAGDGAVGGSTKSSPATPPADGPASLFGAAKLPSVLRRQLLGTDSLNSTEGLVRAAGYPYEAHEVETADGYLLRLDRIPRAGAAECVLLLHGVLDSSMGWVANGALGSIGFAAFDRGFDVFLGNCRGVPPRGHRRGDLGADYWDYTVNEIGTHDVNAMLRGVHRLKMQELRPGTEPEFVGSAEGGRGLPGPQDSKHWRRGEGLGTAGEAPASPAGEEGGAGVSVAALELLGSPSAKLRRLGSAAKDWVQGRGSAGGIGLGSGSGLPARPTSGGPGSAGAPRGAEEGAEGNLPYRLQAVGHSLGGMALLINQTTAWQRPDPQYLRRLVLLTPAGFHHHRVPLVGWIFVALYCARLLSGNSGVYLTHFLLRVLVHKLAKDLHGMPALGHLSNVLCGMFMAGDTSRWDKAALMPHYRAETMPAFSKGVARHVSQLVRSGRFQLYDYGSPARNFRAYGRARPPDVGSSYWRVNVPVDLVAGTNDGIIAPENVREHLHRFKSQGVDVSYSEFEFGHVAFTFAPTDALIRHIFSCLLK